MKHHAHSATLHLSLGLLLPCCLLLHLRTTDLCGQGTPTTPLFLLWRARYLAVSEQEAQETGNSQQQDSR